MLLRLIENKFQVKSINAVNLINYCALYEFRIFLVLYIILFIKKIYLVYVK